MGNCATLNVGQRSNPVRGSSPTENIENNASNTLETQSKNLAKLRETLNTEYNNELATGKNQKRINMLRKQIDDLWYKERKITLKIDYSISKKQYQTALNNHTEIKKEFDKATENNRVIMVYRLNLAAAELKLASFINEKNYISLYNIMMTYDNRMKLDQSIYMARREVAEKQEELKQKEEKIIIS